MLTKLSNNLQNLYPSYISNNKIKNDDISTMTDKHQKTQLKLETYSITIIKILDYIHNQLKNINTLCDNESHGPIFNGLIQALHYTLIWHDIELRSLKKHTYLQKHQEYIKIIETSQNKIENALRPLYQNTFYHSLNEYGINYIDTSSKPRTTLQ